MSAPLLELSVKGNRISITYLGSRYEVSAFICGKLSPSLEDEIRLRGIGPDKPVALVPSSLISSPLQILQGAFHYAVYADKLKRVRNRGLLLAMLMAGFRQLNDFISAAEMEFARSADYYIVALGEEGFGKSMCRGLPLEERWAPPGPVRELLVKNVEAVLSLI